ncbi:MAG: DUF1573 domain-containing protein [Prevotella sp.]|nr:DUF1573 domain-containing protein [Prevotella sp.]
MTLSKKRIDKRWMVLLALFAIQWPLFAEYACAQKLSIRKTTIDVGKTGFMMPVTATFELRNKGSKALTISQLKTDCGCTTVDGPTSVAPGDRFTISLTYDAKLLGHFVKQVAVYSDATKAPVYLKMKGVVLEDLVDYSNRYPYDMNGLLASTNNVEFDDVLKGESPETEILLFNNTEEVMTPNFLHLPSYLSALATPETLEPSRSGKITLILNSEEVGKYGLTQVPVYLARKLGDKVNRNIEIPVSVVLLPDMTDFEGQNRQNAPQLQLSADALTLDKRHKSGTITLSNTGQSMLNISSLQMFTGGMSVKLPQRDLAPGESTKMKVTVSPDQLKKARSKPRVLMITNDPDRAKVVININVE